MADAPTDAKEVALVALTHLIRLMGAELVAGSHRDDIDLLEAAMRDRLASASVPACPPEVADAGLQIAGRFVEQALANIRTQADATQGQRGKRPKSEMH